MGCGGMGRAFSFASLHLPISFCRQSECKHDSWVTQSCHDLSNSYGVKSFDDDREMEFSVRHCSKTEIFTCINSFIHITTLWNRYYYYSHFKDKESKGYIMSIRTRVFWLWRLLPYLFKLFILAKLNDISIYNRNRRSAALHYAKLPQWTLDWQNSWTVYNTVVLLP